METNTMQTSLSVSEVPLNTNEASSSMAMTSEATNGGAMEPIELIGPDFLETVKHNRATVEDIVEKHNRAVSATMKLREEMAKAGEEHGNALKAKDAEIAQRDSIIAELQQKEREREIAQENYKKEQYKTKVEALLSDAVKAGRIPAKDEARIAALRDMALTDEANFDKVKLLVESYPAMTKAEASAEGTSSIRSKFRQTAPVSEVIDRAQLRRMSSHEIRNKLPQIQQSLRNGTLR